MQLNDPTASECLRMLLEEQSRQLRLLEQRINVLCSSSWRATQPTQWTGFARAAHDVAAQHILAKLAIAYVAVDNAVDFSARAVSTLASRVG